MSNTKVLAPRADRQAAANTARELAALGQMSVGELAEKFREVFGEPTRTRNKEYLRKRIAWRIQERAEGGLSPRALERIEQLAPEAPVRWRAPVARKDGVSAAVLPIATVMRDPRLPLAGTDLVRRYRGKDIVVRVREDGFEYAGQVHRSLSTAVRAATGTPWNGFAFFGLGGRPGRKYGSHN